MNKVSILIIVVVLLSVSTANALTIIPIESLGTGSVETDTDVEEYLGKVFQLGIGIAAILAVVMMVLAGVQYTASLGNEGSKSDAKSRIWAAISGLLLVLSAVLILWSINPDLVNLSLGITNI